MRADVLVLIDQRHQSVEGVGVDPARGEVNTDPEIPRRAAVLEPFSDLAVELQGLKHLAQGPLRPLVTVQLDGALDQAPAVGIVARELPALVAHDVELLGQMRQRRGIHRIDQVDQER